MIYMYVISVFLMFYITPSLQRSFVEGFLYTCLLLDCSLSLSVFLFFHIIPEPCLTFSYFLCHHTARLVFPSFLLFVSFFFAFLSCHVSSLPPVSCQLPRSCDYPSRRWRSAPVCRCLPLPFVLEHLPCRSFSRSVATLFIPLRASRVQPWFFLVIAAILDEWPFSALTSSFPPPDSSDCVLTSLPQPFLIF